MFNPYAIYVYCDGAMEYNSKSSGGIGYVIKFPDFIQLDEISTSLGVYTGGNIEKLEMEALIQAMNSIIDLFNKYNEIQKNINQVIFITDRFGLCDSERTNPYKINSWRKNKWKSHDGKPIKNHKLLDELDKARKKLSKISYVRVSIEYKPRKKNKAADKLAKAAKKEGLITEKLANKGEKIGKRKFDGSEIKYSKLIENDSFHVHVFRKHPVQEEWEVWVEICKNKYTGTKLKIYADDILSSKLQRRNEYIIKIKKVYNHYIRIFRTIKKINKNNKSK